MAHATGGKGRKTILFAVDREHAEALFAAFQGAGVGRGFGGLDRRVGRWAEGVRWEVLRLLFAFEGAG